MGVTSFVKTLEKVKFSSILHVKTYLRTLINFVFWKNKLLKSSVIIAIKTQSFVIHFNHKNI